MRIPADDVHALIREGFAKNGNRYGGTAIIGGVYFFHLGGCRQYVTQDVIDELFGELKKRLAAAGYKKLWLGCAPVGKTCLTGRSHMWVAPAIRGERGWFSTPYTEIVKELGIGHGCANGMAPDYDQLQSFSFMQGFPTGEFDLTEER